MSQKYDKNVTSSNALSSPNKKERKHSERVDK